MNERVVVTGYRANWSGPQIWDKEGSYLVPVDSSATVEVDGELAVSATLAATDDGTIGFGRVTVATGESGGAVTATQLRRLPWGAVLDAVVAQVARPVEVITHDDGRVTFRTTDLMLRDKDHESARRAGRAPVGRPKGSRTLDDSERASELRRVADLYRQALDEGRRPALFVATEGPYSAATAGRRIKAARDAGYLEPTRPGTEGISE